LYFFSLPEDRGFYFIQVKELLPKAVTLMGTLNTRLRSEYVEMKEWTI
jgi:hypothetical protein